MRRAQPSPSHGENRGSSPLGSANDFNKNCFYVQRLANKRLWIAVDGQAHRLCDSHATCPGLAITKLCAVKPPLGKPLEQRRRGSFNNVQSTNSRVFKGR
jgi:hypothetical protein